MTKAADRDEIVDVAWSMVVAQSTSTANAARTPTEQELNPAPPGGVEWVAASAQLCRKPGLHRCSPTADRSRACFWPVSEGAVQDPKW